MKILLASTSSEIFSGAVRCLIELADDLNNRGIDVIVTIPKRGDLENELNKRNIKYYYVHEYHSWYTSNKHTKNNFLIKRMLNVIALFKMIKIIKKEEIDIVHVNSLTAYIAGWAASICRIKLVWHIREFMEEDLGITFFNKKYALKKLNKANIMIAISEPIKNKWANILKVPIIVINDGIPIAKYFVKDKNMDKEVIRILTYGRIVQGKGQLFYLKGLKRVLKSTTKKIECYWAGKIEDEQYYKECCQYIDKNDMKKNVHYIGEIDDIKELLSKINIVCVCSKMEGFGRVTVESMLAKCVVLGASTGATMEVINDGINGVIYQEDSLLDFCNKLKNIIENYYEYEIIAKTSQQYACTKFTLEKNIENIIGLYKQLLIE